MQKKIAKILDIYEEYKIMPALQMHMLRVAAVASMICDSIDVPVNKKDIITACLLHDMGNILKFKLDAFPEFLQPNGLEYWQKVKDEYLEKYSSNEYAASIEIAREINVSDRVLELIESISFLGASNNAKGDNFGKKIMEYCDNRVDPFGVVSLEKRLIDLRTRYAHRDLERGPSFREVFEKSVRQMEEQIFSHCKIKPEDINNETVAPIIEELKDFMIE